MNIYTEKSLVTDHCSLAVLRRNIEYIIEIQALTRIGGGPFSRRQVTLSPLIVKNGNLYYFSLSMVSSTSLIVRFFALQKRHLQKSRWLLSRKSFPEKSLLCGCRLLEAGWFASTRSTGDRILLTRISE